VTLPAGTAGSTGFETGWTGTPMSQITLKQGIERYLRDKVPEITTMACGSRGQRGTSLLLAVGRSKIGADVATLDLTLCSLTSLNSRGPQP